MRQWLLALLLSARCAACPACAPLDVTLADELQDAATVVVADQVKGSPTSYRVAVVMKGDLVAGQTLVVPAGSGAARVLLATNAPLRSPIWPGRPRSATAESLAFTRKFLQATSGARLKISLAYLGHSQKELADAACSQLAAAPWSEVARLAPSVPRARLRGWLANTITPAEHRAIYYLLLSRSADQNDLPLLESALRKARQGPAPPDLAALLVCYLSANGDLARVERDFLRSDWDRQLATLEALRVLVNDARELPASAVLPLLRRQLAGERLGAVVLRDLALWKDWSCVPRAVQMFETTREHWVRVAVARYLRSCPLAAAHAALQRLRSLDPSAIAEGRKPF
jgi:hypothetical protein